MAKDTRINRAAGNAHAEDAVATEQTPLLLATSAVPDDLRKAYRRSVVTLCFVIIFIIEVAVSLFVPASTAITELNICHAEHPDLRSRGDYSVCKGSDVQGRLAMLQGWQLTAECIPGIIGAVPYGLLADKWGRRPVIVLSLAGYTLYILFMLLVLYAPGVFTPETILIGPVFALIGGSTMVTSAMAYTMIADVVPVGDRATVFFQFGATFSIAELISGPLAGAVMLKSNWLCMLLGLGLWVLANLICCMLPETLEVRRLADQLDTADNNDGDNEDTDSDAINIAQNEVGDDDDDKRAGDESLISAAKHQLQSSTAEVRDFAVANRGLFFLMLSLVFVVLSRVVQMLLLQFTTKKFNWTWSQAAFLLSIRSGSSVATSLLILPAVSRLLTAPPLALAPILKDTLIARGTGCLGILGALMIALSPDPYTLSAGLVVFGFAGGMAVAVRSLLNALVEPRHAGMLNAVLGLLEQVGLMAAGPLFSKALKTGIQLGGAWVGLPFLVACAYMVVATAIVFLFRAPKGGGGMGGYTVTMDGSDDDDDDEESCQRAHS